ncbi:MULTISPECIES: GGDEF domain-containing protein [unclassified Sphingomonas]|uniref:GGDEF domain-containing protein n=1 Tax=unclassified Sphingomonas TaxID=196159 RepID=UPI0007001751|nr:MULTISPECIES: diguanylate cyclase [unclassified Sphingomonas]
MQIEIAHARAALAFLEYHQLEPSAFNYGTALAHLSGSYKILSDDILASIEGAGLTNTRFVELGAAQAAAAATLADHPGTSPVDADDASIVQRVAATERSLAELREQVARLLATGAAGRTGAVDAEHDELTNALNQTGARRVLDKIAAQDQRYALLMFGIDGLPGINRIYGNSVGDNILNAFATKLAKAFPDQEAIRWSGNEFILAIPGQTMTALRAQAEEALQLLQGRKFKLRGSGEAIGTVTASAAMVAGHGNGIEWVIDEARAKLQGVMLAGGNRVVH